MSNLLNKLMKAKKYKIVTDNGITVYANVSMINLIQELSPFKENFLSNTSATIKLSRISLLDSPKPKKDKKRSKK